MLTKEEAKRHDELFMCEMLATLEDKTLGTGASKLLGKDTRSSRLVYETQCQSIHGPIRLTPCTYERLK